MRILWISAVLAFLADQISKYLVIHVLEVSPFNSIDVFPPLVRFIYSENRGINFGLGYGIPVWVLVSIAALICVAVVWWLTRHPQSRLAYLSAGLLVGGALANVLDRLIFGYVQDFLNMSCCGIDNPFVFNVADIFIFAGAFGLVFFAQEGKGRKKGA
ncbi:MAG: signal peptidase II [Pseudomonadota bacterium]